MNEIIIHKLVSLKNEIDEEMAKEQGKYSEINENIKCLQKLMTSEIMNGLDELNVLRIKLGLSERLDMYAIDTGYELNLMRNKDHCVCTIGIGLARDGHHCIFQNRRTNIRDHGYNTYDIFHSRNQKWEYDFYCSAIYQRWEQIKNAAENVIVNNFIEKCKYQMSSIDKNMMIALDMLKETRKAYNRIDGKEDVM